MTIYNPSDNQKNTWDAIVNHPLQSWAWGEFRKQMGITVERLANGKKDKLTEGWQVTFHKIPHTPWTIGYFPKGPEISKSMLDLLIETGKKHQAIYIQIEPNVLASHQLSDISYPQLIPSHHPLFTKYTFVLDLTKPIDELMQAMHPKTRYNIKIASKHHVVIKEDSSDVAFQKYLKLEAETTSRQKFFAHSENYHRRMWETMKKAGIAKLWTASVENETLAAWILFLWKDTIYYPYGASSRNQRETMAPNLLLWEIAKWGKQNGYKKFDLWGAIGPSPDPEDPWYGFHRFKAGYNPDLIEYIGSYDLIINPVLYKAYCLTDKLRWKLLKIFK
jgi:lipid II:glycine glycyltransferase (peptidoglycan interpeptide bridge formation enzyme)